ncbi:MAG: deoxyribodipyrimidine photo-lyase, partial [Candidatus Sumerlaeaceae bacterium]|nr:deoxyribodipyrimidine photo-lyase [Candidatus Sumerlaeaceae bacterium]
MIHPARIRALNSASGRTGSYVLYWMQQAQRTICNHALEYAIREANDRKLPVVVAFGITDDYPEANERHYAFMLEGLRDVELALRRRNIPFVVRHKSPELTAVELSRNAALLVCDRGYLKIQKAWRTYVATHAHCPVVQVETDVVVPVETASNKEEFAARTIRPKITRLLGDFLQPLAESTPRHQSAAPKFDSLDVTNVDALLARLKIDRSVTRVSRYIGGQAEAARRMDQFAASKLAAYAEDRNEPALEGVSHMSPYLHFGQVSPLDLALRIRGSRHHAGVEAYLEEMIVRRELSMNFVHFNPRYDHFECLPPWARQTLGDHQRDERPYVYTLEQLEAGGTHDPYWNAAQREMTATGKMHNYMRMYWGKKILEWSPTPQQA